MTEEEKSTNYDTFRHIERVRNLLNKCIVELVKRGELHDQSKMASPEVEVFAKYTRLLANCEYNSEEYRKNLAEMKPALDHHYANNRHHPEHHKNGINDMNLIDLIELLCDWKASSERQNNGNIRKSIETNANRFNMSQQLVKIFENSVDLF